MGVASMLSDMFGRPIRREIAMLVRLIQNDRDWIKATHTWYHPSGVTLWVGNMDIRIASVKWNSTGPNDYATPSDAGKWRLTWPEFKAVHDAMLGKTNNKQSDATIVAERIIAMYGRIDQ